MSNATKTVSQFDVECKRNSDISQKFQDLVFFPKRDGFSERNAWYFQKRPKKKNLL